MTEIVIPQSVTSIDASAFRGCTNIVKITVKEGNTVYHSDNNCLIETESRTLILGCQNSSIPNDGSVTSIGRYAFNGCIGLTSVEIPDCVTNIGYAAFRGCTGLTTLVIPNSVITIEDYAFAECSEISSLTMGNNVEKIGSYAFSDCTALTGVTIPASVTTIDSYAFYRSTKITYVNFEVTSGWMLGSAKFEDLGSNLGSTSSAAYYLVNYYTHMRWTRTS